MEPDPSMALPVRDPALVSTIIPVHNRPALLREAVASVLAQTYRPIEIVIVDDGSTDDTAAVADELARLSSIPILVIRQANAGPGAARQRGLDQAKGSFIQFLDSDDLLLPPKFAAQVEALQRQPECQICYGPSLEENHALRPVQRQGPMRATGMVRRTLFPYLLVERWWTTSSPLYRRALLDQIGPWRSWINEEDWEYDGRAGATGAALAWVPMDVSVRRIHLLGGHLSDRGCEDPRKLAHRAMAKASLFKCARQAGVSNDSNEMRFFSRSAFLLSRQCGLAGVAGPSRNLFQLALEASTPEVRASLEYRLYRLLAKLLGWCGAARLSVYLHDLLTKLRGGRHAN
jgi:glycosyltransferase involved in cell wall biosynthesis